MFEMASDASRGKATLCVWRVARTSVVSSEACVNGMSLYRIGVGVSAGEGRAFANNPLVFLAVKGVVNTSPATVPVDGVGHPDSIFSCFRFPGVASASVLTAFLGVSGGGMAWSFDA